MIDKSGFEFFLDSLEWLDVESGVATIGCKKRGVLRAGIGPAHEVKVPERFQITKAAIPISEVLSHFDEDSHNEVDAGKSDIDMRLIKLGVRLPTEAEWTLAVAAGITGEADTVELLIDWISETGYWGLPCDGRPRLDRPLPDSLSKASPVSNNAGAHSKQRVVRVWRKSSSSAAKPSASASTEKSVDGLVDVANSNEELTVAHSMLLPQLDGRVATIRLVRPVSPTSTENSDWADQYSPRLPQGYDPVWRLKQEVIIAFVVGIIPSFIWAFFNATPGYIESGWLNLLMGGAFIGVMSGAIWRPNGFTYRLAEDGKSMRECKK